jgi:hypothetical protein
MPDIWKQHEDTLANVRIMNARRPCRCGARDWRPTFPLGIHRLLDRKGFIRAAFECRQCDRVTHIGPWRFKRYTASIHAELRTYFKIKEGTN